MLLAAWATYSPSVRREVLEALFARPDRLPHLLKAIEEGRVLAGQLEPFRIERPAQARRPGGARRRGSFLPGMARRIARESSTPTARL